MIAFVCFIGFSVQFQNPAFTSFDNRFYVLHFAHLSFLLSWHRQVQQNLTWFSAPIKLFPIVPKMVAFTVFVFELAKTLPIRVWFCCCPITNRTKRTSFIFTYSYICHCLSFCLYISFMIPYTLRHSFMVRVFAVWYSYPRISDIRLYNLLRVPGRLPCHNGSSIL